jgi:hypothetical protein
MMLCCLFLVLSLPAARAAIQFDVFLGYDDLVREANWFPVACEIHNDGPTFTGVFELSSEQFGRGQVRRMVIELPTNTRKRFVIPVFGSGGRYASWNARLLDDRGKVRAESPTLRPRREVSWQSTVLGALPRAFNALPQFPDLRNARNDAAPEVARLQAKHFPDNPIALEGLDAIYLHVEPALELEVPQVNALTGWLAGGGHLIVCVEQVTDLNGAPWLRALLPAEPTGPVTVRNFESLEDWVQKGGAQTPATPVSKPGVARRQAALTSDPYAAVKADDRFAVAEMPAMNCTLRDGRTIVDAGGVPLAIEAKRGRGRVTLLTFSPEREPFRSWKNRDWFWARLLAVPPESLSAEASPRYSYQSIDGVFGAMIDSRQVRKLPVSWLLLLLLVYLLVIGPVDQYSLKKLNKQMLTWITFPCYVVGFSLLIYWIGFLLRAGETEWNELHVVDVIPRGQKADLRGRAFGSVYSPSNARYPLADATTGDQSRRFATLRGEHLGAWGGQESSRGHVLQRGDGFEAEVFVPVWTSQLFISDWLQSSEAPLVARVERLGQGFKATVENKLPRRLTDVHLVIDGRVHTIGAIDARASHSLTSTEAGLGSRLPDFVRQHAGSFHHAVQQRQRAFGDTSAQRIGNPSLSTMAASFLPAMAEGRQAQYGETFVMPSRFDLTPLAEEGRAIVLAWDEGGSLIGPINQFEPRRQSKQTLLRLAVPVQGVN